MADGFNRDGHQQAAALAAQDKIQLLIENIKKLRFDATGRIKWRQFLRLLLLVQNVFDDILIELLFRAVMGIDGGL